MEDGIFFNQSKYIKEMLKKFRLKDSKPTKMPMSTEIKLTKDDDADSMDSSKYQSMIGSLLYLTASSPDIMFSVCLCARFQENPKTTHLEVVKHIFRRTARISVLPIEPNLAERARISAINLDDYQLDPVTPPPSPSSPFSMAAYQRMIAETDPTRREEALTAYGMETGQGSVPVPKTVLTELEAFLTLWDVKPRVEESSLETLSVDELITQLRQVCEDAEDRASNAQEEARQKRKEALEEVVQRIYRNNN
ncbi:hypothetical protein Tco_0843026 [Tanacetum coccineum]|uniref:Retrovirus-related Pol polyprotein from transposon TNT 1-94 n=1 Tax=Tanacetum coccineum TaxID=301880 RepID=A0ABQ5B596_9ASTR